VIKKSSAKRFSLVADVFDPKFRMHQSWVKLYSAAYNEIVAAYTYVAFKQSHLILERLRTDELVTGLEK
jgi:hypothetical protein